MYSALESPLTIQVQELPRLCMHEFDTNDLVPRKSIQEVNDVSKRNFLRNI